MVKFSDGEDEDYKVISGHLFLMAGFAKSQIEARWNGTESGASACKLKATRYTLPSGLTQHTDISVDLSAWTGISRAAHDGLATANGSPKSRSNATDT